MAMEPRFQRGDTTWPRLNIKLTIGVGHSDPGLNTHQVPLCPLSYFSNSLILFSHSQNKILSSVLLIHESLSISIPKSELLYFIFLISKIVMVALLVVRLTKRNAQRLALSKLPINDSFYYRELLWWCLRIKVILDTSLSKNHPGLRWSSLGTYLELFM